MYEKSVTKQKVKANAEIRFELKDKLTDMLMDEKQLLLNYQTAISGMINNDMRDVLIENRDDIQGAQIGFLNDLLNIGEYNVDSAADSVIDMLFTFKNKGQLMFETQ
ncbi:MAG: spore coat protein [Christensenellales bacterium]